MKSFFYALLLVAAAMPATTPVKAQGLPTTPAAQATASKPVAVTDAEQTKLDLLVSKLEGLRLKAQLLDTQAKSQMTELQGQYAQLRQQLTDQVTAVKEVHHYGPDIVFDEATQHLVEQPKQTENKVKTPSPGTETKK